MCQVVNNAVVMVQLCRYRVGEVLAGMAGKNWQRKLKLARCCTLTNPRNHGMAFQLYKVEIALA